MRIWISAIDSVAGGRCITFLPRAVFIIRPRAGAKASDQHQYLSMRSRFGILTITMGKKRHVALAHIALWALVQFLSEVASLRHGVLRPDLPRAWSGRVRGFMSCLTAADARGWRSRDLSRTH